MPRIPLENKLYGCGYLHKRFKFMRRLFLIWKLNQLPTKGKNLLSTSPKAKDVIVITVIALYKYSIILISPFLILGVQRFEHIHSIVLYESKTCLWGSLHLFSSLPLYLCSILSMPLGEFSAVRIAQILPKLVKWHSFSNLVEGPIKIIRNKYIHTYTYTFIMSIRIFIL